MIRAPYAAVIRDPVGPVGELLTLHLRDTGGAAVAVDRCLVHEPTMLASWVARHRPIDGDLVDVVHSTSTGAEV